MAIAEAELTAKIYLGMEITEDELMRLPDDGFLYELEGGLLTGKPAVSVWESVVAANAIGLLGPHARGHGFMTCGKGGFRMANGNIRVPTLSFTRKNRFPGGHAPEGFGDLAPDLCVEIISPSEKPADMARKVRDYFQSDAVQVWHVFPEAQQVTVFTSPAGTQTFSAEDTLTAGGIVPGFSCLIRDIFSVE